MLLIFFFFFECLFFLVGGEGEKKLLKRGGDFKNKWPLLPNTTQRFHFQNLLSSLELNLTTNWWRAGSERSLREEGANLSASR